MAQPQPVGLLNTPQLLQAYLNSCPPGLTRIGLPDSQITSLEGVVFPSTLTVLNLDRNKITSLEGVVFPPALTQLVLDSNQITSLEGVVFPLTLKRLFLNDNKITSLEGVKFPHTLVDLYLRLNQITSLKGVQFPPALITFNFAGNPLTSLTGMINPSDLVEKTLMAEYPLLYVRDIANEKVKLKTAKKEVTDSYKLSINNRINTITSFLREGMEARSNENAELLKGTSSIKVMIYGKVYLVPFDATMSVQSVLDYLNDKYYISALVPNCSVMHLNYNGSTLEPEQTLADYNVQIDSQINVKCKIEINYGGKRAKQTIKKSKKRVKKYTNKSIRNCNKVRKI